MTSYVISLPSTLRAISSGISTVYTLVKTANLIYSMNPYLVLSLTFYASFNLLKNFVYRPLKHLLKFVYM